MAAEMVLAVASSLRSSSCHGSCHFSLPGRLVLLFGFLFSSLPRWCSVSAAASPCGPPSGRHGRGRVLSVLAFFCLVLLVAVRGHGECAGPDHTAGEVIAGEGTSVSRPVVVTSAAWAELSQKEHAPRVCKLGLEWAERKRRWASWKSCGPELCFSFSENN